MSLSTSVPDFSGSLVWTGGTTTSITNTSFGDTSRTFIYEPPVSGGTYSWKTFLDGTGAYKLDEPGLDEEELEALIGTVIDGLIERCLHLGDLPKSMESKSPGLFYVSEGAGVDSTVWAGDSTYRPIDITANSSSTYWSSTREGEFISTDGGV